MDPKRVNIGIPYYSMNRTKNLKIYNEPIWRSLSQKCPNINPNLKNSMLKFGKKNIFGLYEAL